jgi:hypothetical protein
MRKRVEQAAAELVLWYVLAEPMWTVVDLSPSELAERGLGRTLLLESRSMYLEPCTRKVFNFVVDEQLSHGKFAADQ